MISQSRPYIYLTVIFVAGSLLMSRAYKDSVTLYSVGDDDFYWSYPRSLIYDHDLRFDNEPLPTFAQNPKLVNFASPFPGLLWSPAVLAGKLLSPVIKRLPSAQPEIVEKGYSIYQRLLISAFSAGLTLLGLYLLFAAMSLILEPIHAFVGTAVCFLATPLPYYTFRRPLMSHSAEFFSLSLLAFASLRFLQRPSVGRGLLFGLSISLAVGVRYPNVFVVGTWLLALCFQRPEKTKAAFSKILPALSAFTGVLLLLALQFVIWKSVRGTWIPQSGQYSMKPANVISYFLPTRETLRGIFDIFVGGG